MRVKDTPAPAKGEVSPSFLDIRTGRRMPFSKRSNKLSYMSAEAMAAAFGGDLSYIPARIGIIYGDQQVFPSGTAEISRNQSWDDLFSKLSSASQGATVDVQVVGFSYAPSLGCGDGGSSSSDGGSDYGHIISTGANAVTFHAVSNSQDRGSMFNADTFKDGSYIYQCLLLGYHAGKYYILARASLESFDTENSGGVYLRKPKGFEVAIDWTVTFM